MNPVRNNGDTVVGCFFFQSSHIGIQIQIHFHGSHFLAKGNQQLLVPLLYPRSTKWEGRYTGMKLFVCPSVRLSVCRHNPVNAFPGAIRHRLWPILVGMYLGARSRTSWVMGGVAR